MTYNLNDNGISASGRAVPEPDAHGHAAYLLTESLIHGLVARSALSVDAAIEIVEIAAEVKVEIAPALGDSPATLRRSLSMLESLATSLRSDKIS